MKPAYRYAVTIQRVIDGDTLVGDVDLGFRTWLHGVRIRLLGLDCPEIDTVEGEAAKAFVNDSVDRAMGSGIIESVKMDKFNRWDATLYLSGETSSLNEQLLQTGHAKKV